MSAVGKSKMAKVQRKTALRVFSAYCNVSADAVLVVVSMPPIDILAEERLFMFNNKDDPRQDGKPESQHFVNGKHGGAS